MGVVLGGHPGILQGDRGAALSRHCSKFRRKTVKTLPPWRHRMIARFAGHTTASLGRGSEGGWERGADPVGAGRFGGRAGGGLAALDQPAGDQLADGRGGAGTLVVFAFAVLRWSAGKAVLEALTDGVNAVIDSTNVGIQFLFGPLIPDPKEGVVFALQVLPVIFFASLMAVLYYLRIISCAARTARRRFGAPGRAGRRWGDFHILVVVLVFWCGVDRFLPWTRTHIRQPDPTG
jgi:Na+ dependent nucleoside transporter N-terminus